MVTVAMGATCPLHDDDTGEATWMPLPSLKGDDDRQGCDSPHFPANKTALRQATGGPNTA